MRWDNIPVVYGSTFLWALVASIKSPRALRALGLQIEPTCAHRKVLRTLDWSLFHRNHYNRLASCSGKDFSTLKLWKLSDFKNLKNSEGAS